MDAAEIWTEGVAATSSVSNGLELRAGVAMPEVTDLSATDWNGCTRAGTSIVAWKFAKPEDKDKGDGWVAAGVTAGAWEVGMKD